MKGVKEIRRRLAAIQNTAKITRAMQLVASSKMRKAQQLAVCSRPYMLLLTEIAENLSKLDEKKLKHPFFKNREIKTRGILVIGTEKGLCGSLNQSVSKFLNFNFRKGDAVKIATVGRKITNLVASAGHCIVSSFHVSDRAEYHEIIPIVEFARNAFLSEEIDSLDIIFARYENPLVQEPAIQHVLPMLDFNAELERFRKTMGIASDKICRDERPVIVEPDISSVLSMLGKMFLNQNIYRVILEAKASEHSARAAAMRGATDNAEELSKQLSLEYNKLRQAAITNEIIEISAASAVA